MTDSDIYYPKDANDYNYTPNINDRSSINPSNTDNNDEIASEPPKNNETPATPVELQVKQIENYPSEDSTNNMETPLINNNDEKNKTPNEIDKIIKKIDEPKKKTNNPVYVRQDCIRSCFKNYSGLRRILVSRTMRLWLSSILVWGGLELLILSYIGLIHIPRKWLFSAMLSIIGGSGDGGSDSDGEGAIGLLVFWLIICLILIIPGIYPEVIFILFYIYYFYQSMEVKENINAIYIISTILTLSQLYLLITCSE